MTFLHTDILVIAPVIGLLCDNAMSSTLLNHLGSTSIKLCRLCTVSFFSIVQSNSCI